VTQLVSSTPPEQIDSVVVLWSAFPYVCPEAVLATGSFLCINGSNDKENTNADGQKGAVFAPVTALPSAGFVQETASGELQASCRAKEFGTTQDSHFEFFLRLSRACLGKLIGFSVKWRKKAAFPYPQRREGVWNDEGQRAAEAGVGRVDRGAALRARHLPTHQQQEQQQQEEEE
jgi:hypothetical protein